MSQVLLDTAGWFAALNPREARHRQARSAYEALLRDRVSLVASNLVVAEMHILLTRARGPAEGLRFLDALWADLRHEVVFVDRELELDATERWLRRFADLPLSLADVISFELARRRKIRRVLTLDRHFSTAGFERIPD